MQKKISFDIRDIFRSGRMGLNPKKILMHFLGIIIGYVIYEMLIYLSLSGSGVAGEFWQRYGLCPMFFLLKPSMAFSLATIIMAIIGAVVWLLIYLLFSTAVCKVAIEELKGDDFYSIREAFKFAFRKVKTIYVSILGLIAIILFCLLFPSLVGLVDLIPKVELVSKHFGTPLITLFSLIIYFVSLFMVLTLIVCLFSICLIPAVIAVTEEDVLETIYQLYLTLWHQPWRLIIYNKLLWIMEIFGIFIFAVISFVGMYIIFIPSILLAKQESFYLADVFARALKIVGADCLIQFVPGANLANVDSMPWTLDLSTFFLFIAFIMIGAIVVAYPMAMNSCGQTIIYVILRKKISGENMLEIKEENPTKEKTNNVQNTEPSQES